MIRNALGMHARPASRIAQIAEEADSLVWLCSDEQKVDATSIIDILTLCAVQGTQITIEIEDRQDTDVLERIYDYFEAGFGEIEA